MNTIERLEAILQGYYAHDRELHRKIEGLHFTIDELKQLKEATAEEEIQQPERVTITTAVRPHKGGRGVGRGGKRVAGLTNARILDYFHAHPGESASPSMLSIATGLTYGAVASSVHRMQRAGVLELTEPRGFSRLVEEATVPADILLQRKSEQPPAVEPTNGAPTSKDAWSTIAAWIKKRGMEPFTAQDIRAALTGKVSASYLKETIYPTLSYRWEKGILKRLKPGVYQATKEFLQ